MQRSFSIAHHTVVAQAKFFSRSGHKFFLTATRLDGLGTTLDLYEKLKLRRRLEDLKAAHTSGLILAEGQSQPALELHPVSEWWLPAQVRFLMRLDYPPPET